MAPTTTSSTDDGTALVLPDRLYGRDAPYARLADAWQEAAAGERVLALVSGYSGVGKTALVQRLRAEVVAGGGLFVAGKHDQLRRGTPYLAIAEALTQLAHRLRDLPAAEFTSRANALRAGMGGLGRLMLELAPALGPVLGDPPPVPVLSGVEARRRSALAFRIFMAVAASAAHPLTMFLDDLQWVDAASLDLFRAVVCDEGETTRGGLLLVTAYRENEVGQAHPFARAVQEAEAVGGPAVRRVSLGGLPRSDVREFLADLFDDCAAAPREETLALADALHAKTAGNPFFLRTLLLDLHGSGALRCTSRRWEWDDAAVARLGVAENVAELRATRLHKLSRNAQEALAVAARLGGSFEFALLAEATGVTTEALVHPAQGVLVDADREGLVELSADSATFVHDRVQQAALALVPEAGRRALGERSR